MATQQKARCHAHRCCGFNFLHFVCRAGKAPPPTRPSTTSASCRIPALGCHWAPPPAVGLLLSLGWVRCKGTLGRKARYLPNGRVQRGQNSSTKRGEVSYHEGETRVQTSSKFRAIRCRRVCSSQASGRPSVAQLQLSLTAERCTSSTFFMVSVLWAWPTTSVVTTGLGPQLHHSPLGLIAWNRGLPIMGHSVNCDRTWPSLPQLCLNNSAQASK